MSAATALIGVFAGFRLIYVAAAVAVVVVVFTANELWWARKEADRQLEAEARDGNTNRAHRESVP